MATKKKVIKKTTKRDVKKKSARKSPKKVLQKVVKKTAVKKVVKKAVKKTVKPIKNSNVKPATKPSKITPKVNIDYSKVITPLGDRLVVRVLNTERVTSGGLIIPDSASLATGYLKATVLAVGVGAKSKKGHLRPLDVKVGDMVLFSEHAGTKVSFNLEDLQIIHESDVMGVV